MNSSNSSPTSLADLLSTRDFLKIQEEARALEVRRKQEAEQARIRQAQEAEKAKLAAQITEKDVLDAEKRGYEKGLQEGQKQEREKILKEHAAHFNMLEKKIESHLEISEKYTAVVLKQSVETLSFILKALFDDIAQRYPQEMFERVIKRALSVCPKDAVLNIVVNPSTHIYMADVAQNLIQSQAYKIKEDASLDKGDCFIEWDGRGLKGSMQSIQNDMEKILEGFKQGIHPLKIELPPLEEEVLEKTAIENPVPPEKLEDSVSKQEVEASQENLES